MSSIDPIDLFPHPELTPIPADTVPDFASLKIIHRQVNANAMTIPSTRGGGAHGHLALVIPAADYALIPGTIPWVDPVHPGPNPVYPVLAPTAPQIHAAERQYKVDLEDVKLHQATRAQLKKQVLTAVPDTFLRTLKHDSYGYANVSVLEMLVHLDTTYGAVTADDLDDNITKMNAEWSPTQPIEDLWNQIEQCRRYAQPHDPITELAATRSAIQNLTNAGVFMDALKDWRKRPAAQQTWDNVKLDFNAADKERRRNTTTAQLGFANKATRRFEEEKKEDDHQTKPAKKTTMGYCWSHGYGNNPNHTSATCTNPQGGHRIEATVDNMLGGCCIIKRKNGEKAVYKRPQRPQPASENIPAEK